MKRSNAVRAGDDGETIHRLLDTAERLFGEHGYDGVGMRMLAQEAHVNLGAATYHFGSKKALFLEALMRRFRPLNAERLALLREARATGPLTVEKIADCLVRPAYALAVSHPSFHALQARNLVTPPAFLHAAIYREIEPNAREFTAALRECLPHLPENLIGLRIMFAIGCMLMFSNQVRRSAVAHDADLRERMLRELVRFIAAGLQSEPAVPGATWPAPEPPRRRHA
jgi:AcrR family transcriptional regulator